MFFQEAILQTLQLLGLTHLTEYCTPLELHIGEKYAEKHLSVISNHDFIIPS